MDLTCFVDIRWSSERGRLFWDMLFRPFIYTFCQGNMNTVREMSGKCQGILMTPVAMNPGHVPTTSEWSILLPKKVSYITGSAVALESIWPLTGINFIDSVVWWRQITHPCCPTPIEFKRTDLMELHCPSFSTPIFHSYILQWSRIVTHQSL